MPVRLNSSTRVPEGRKCLELSDIAQPSLGKVLAWFLVHRP